MGRAPGVAQEPAKRILCGPGLVPSWFPLLILACLTASCPRLWLRMGTWDKHDEL